MGLETTTWMIALVATLMFHVKHECICGLEGKEGATQGVWWTDPWHDR